MHKYKIQLTQNLKPDDHERWRQFSGWVLERLAVDNNFAKQIIFSDEAQFYFGGLVIKQNCQIWENENPQIIQEDKINKDCVVWFLQVV